MSTNNLQSCKRKKFLHGHGRQSSSIDDLGLDILVYEILIRLPAKGVGRSKCVCKEWLSVLSTRHFAMMHCRHISTSYNQKFIAIDSRLCSVFPLSCEDSGPLLNSRILLPFEAPWNKVNILTSFEGLLCVCFRNTGKLVIWNPLTRAFKEVSSSNSRGLYKPKSDAIGLYVDKTDDYKLLHIKRRRGRMWVHVYSSMFDSWHKITFANKLRCWRGKPIWSNGTFCKGVLYFLVNCFIENKGVMLFGFDVESERFRLKTFPRFPHAYYDGNLVVVHKELHVFITHGLPNWTVDLWRMEGESWVKLWVFPRIQPPIILSCSITHITSTGRFLVVSNDGVANEIDTTKKGVDCFLPLVWFHGLQGAIYTETLSSPDFYFD
ncbi:putative F-box associated interaction domain, F-box-like domain superfamily [Helianthus annuus]|uniref:F-box associated interaction domain, F-box-like domain superfamily n=1 Tax=Helianthus annuus TaxID=4232 RepID=A0A9K3DZ40_HELAN|nr:putative F-box associated interaction domain, F-box-like domain superfamily [Helianthus annuus]KAJ0449963.1 putative F-box associated interaction domain, F-box-like domain superfamily [Helianthus annuus]KAJ0471687.1 putative F-box associated interaction domain, F-box-like domain superfamily [Helianthus annuus]